MRRTIAVATLAVLWNVPVQGFGKPEEQSAVATPSSPNSPTVSTGEKGLQLLSQGKYNDAVPELRQAVRMAPDSSKYALGYAEALLSAHYKFTALGFLESVTSRFEALPEYRYTLGLAYYLCYHYQDAIKVFETIPQDDPKFNRIPFLIGNCYMALSDLRQAETYFRKAIALKPDDPTYYVSLGKMLRMEEPARLDEAIAALKKAWALDSHDAYVGLHLAYCEEGKGEYQQAQIVLEEVVQKRPDFQPAHLALAAVYDHNHEADKARQQREMAARLKPPPTPLNPR